MIQNGQKWLKNRWHLLILSFKKKKKEKENLKKKKNNTKNKDNNQPIPLGLLAKSVPKQKKTRDAQHRCCKLHTPFIKFVCVGFSQGALTS